MHNDRQPQTAIFDGVRTKQARGRANYSREKSPDPRLSTAQHQVKRLVGKESHTLSVRRRKFALASLPFQPLEKQRETHFTFTYQEHPHNVPIHRGSFRRKCPCRRLQVLLNRARFAGGKPQYPFNLRGVGWARRVIECTAMSDAHSFLLEQTFSAVFCSDSLPDGDFRTIIVAAGCTPVIVFSRLADWDRYLDAVQTGATHRLNPAFSDDLSHGVPAFLVVAYNQYWFPSQRLDLAIVNSLEEYVSW
jgi:hypothetical protein